MNLLYIWFDYIARLQRNEHGERALPHDSLEEPRVLFDGALAVARQQVKGGANILDVNMDEGMIDSEVSMTRFLNLIGSEPEISRIPMMIDSSKWSVIEAGLKCVQGKGVVNSISLKNGEEEFLREAQLVRRYGAAMIVMAFDEQGQADTLQRKTEVCARAYRLLTESAHVPPNGSESITATLHPAARHWDATVEPVVPVPITTRSNLSCTYFFSPSGCEG